MRICPRRLPLPFRSDSSAEREFARTIPRLCACLAVFPTLLAVAGCGLRVSPSTPLFGAYFPSWLICVAIGVLGSVAVRAVFIRLGIDDVLPWKLIVYLGIAGLLASGCALLVYGR